MDKIIFEIKKAKELQGLSDNALAKKAGLNQVRVSRLLNGTTKKLDFEVIERLQRTLGITGQPLTIAEQIGEGYGPEVKLMADYLEVKIKGKTPEERLQIVEEIMAEIRARYK